MEYSHAVDVIDASAKFLELATKASEGLGQVISDPELEARLDRITTHLGSYGVDPFGFDPSYLRKVMGAVAWVYRHYFRVLATGVSNIPDGRCLIISNHSGQLPYDGAMIGAAVFLEHEPPRIVRAMLERFVPSTPFASTFLARIGQILGTPENCRRLLQAEEVIQIFPEGVAGLNKTWGDRYKLQRFGTGFMRLAIEMNCPVVPVAVVGAEEQAPSIYNLRSLGRLLGMPAFPITPAPFCGIVPLPTRYRIAFGEPMYFDGDANDEDEVINNKVQQVRDRVQTMVNEGLAAREHVFW